MSQNTGPEDGTGSTSVLALTPPCRTVTASRLPPRRGACLEHGQQDTSPGDLLAVDRCDQDQVDDVGSRDEPRWAELSQGQARCRT
jgi:hypothetical protein